MTKRKTVGLTEAWWVWLGDASAIRVATQDEAIALLERDGKNCDVGNQHGRVDCACAVAQIVWNEPFHDASQEANGYHKVVMSPVLYVLWRGKVRKLLAARMTPSKLAARRRSWEVDASGNRAWWPKQYDEAVNDPETVIPRGKRSLAQLMSESEPAKLPGHAG